MPKGFVRLEDVSPGILKDLKYSTSNNIVGRPLRGYEANASIWLTEQAAKSLDQIQVYLQSYRFVPPRKGQSLSLLVYDAYRPQMASDDFFKWAHDSDMSTKGDYYPNIEKSDFFKLGYIAQRSSHSRGSTCDVTLVDTRDRVNRSLDMGTEFDFMDRLSWPTCEDVSEEIYENRQCLQKLMTSFGWQGIEQEWWHFTLQDEPFMNTYFNFPVKEY